MALLLIRHGETALNVARTLQPAATPLGARGKVQAERLARRLAGRRIRAVVSSDLPRALETAQAIAAAAGLGVRLEPRLQERNFGDLRGRPYDSFGFDPLTMTEAPPGGEAGAAFGRRVEAAFAAVRALHGDGGDDDGAGGDLVVVTHGLVIRHLVEHVLAVPAARLRACALGNASITEVDARPPHAVTLLGCVAHLDTGDDAGSAGNLAGG